MMISTAAVMTAGFVFLFFISIFSAGPPYTVTALDTGADRIIRFFSFSKKAFLSCSNSASVQTALHIGSNDFVTAKHSRMFSHGYSLHWPHVSISRSLQHLTTWYLHQFSVLQPVQDISSFDTI